MISRTLQLPKNNSFFVFGPRQTGKSTLIKDIFFQKNSALYYNLLLSKEYLRLSANPTLLREEVMSRKPEITHVIVDEIQRIPALLDEIHALMEGPRAPYFCLSGSSARKLKRAHANLLAGRAWTYHLYPLTYRELAENFSLEKALNLGTLPPVYLNPSETGAKRTLKSYVETYLKEEIKQEALVRNIGGFLRFLRLAADENGNMLNYSNIARETGTSYQTVKEYFQILEDTLVGFLLLPFSKSSRKRLVKHPKFYFFDLGVHRALTQKLSVPLEKGTSDFGNAFEHFLILEIMRLADYGEKDYGFSFYHTESHAEVDLIVETPKGTTYAVEIKSSEHPDLSQLKGLRSFAEICPNATLICASLAPRRRVIQNITILPWQEVFGGLEI